MGNNTVTRQAPPSDAAKLRRTYAAMVAADLAEYGHDPYSGHLNTKRGDGIEVDEHRLFATRESAREWLDGRHPGKHGPALAVRYVLERRPPDQASTRLAELRRELAGLPAGMIARARASGSTTVGCKACGSDIATAWIGQSANRDHFGRVGAGCPVCGDARFLTTEQDDDSRALLDAEIARTEGRLAGMVKASDADTVRNARASACPWLILAGCSC